ncbi:hypothetical protein M9Y10_014061 [Tritrichomonas musculus]|uniref:Inner membrane protein n=1 Tax=Tritrichomonas musculus TaxID=1915356 RepID=A0ABR2KYG4_9EUKA
MNDLGDPLQYDSSKVNIIRDRFRQFESDFENSSIKTKIEPTIFGKDPRTIYIYNFHNILDIKNNNGDNLILAILNALIEIVDSANVAVKIARKSGEITYKLFESIAFKRLAGTQALKTIADFIGTDEELAIKFFISSTFSTFGMIATSIIGTLATILTASCPFVSLFISGMNLFFFYESRVAQIQMEKGKNHILLLNYLFNRLSNIENVMQSNVLIVAIDEYKSFFSFFRSNAGVYCEARYINGLRSAPRARELPGSRNIIQELVNIRQEISQNGNINIERIRRKIASYYQFNGIMPNNSIQ